MTITIIDLSINKISVDLFTYMIDTFICFIYIGYILDKFYMFQTFFLSLLSYN